MAHFPARRPTGPVWAKQGLVTETEHGYVASAHIMNAFMPLPPRAGTGD